MKITITLLALFTLNNCFAQTDTSASNVIFFDDFNNNKNNWTIADNKKESSSMEGGVYYLTALGHAYGETQEIKIDTRKDFEIEARIKMVSGDTDHRFYYSMLFWGRGANDGNYFTFAKDGFASVELCDGIHQFDCIAKSASLKKTMLSPGDFNVYTIKKTGNIYSFFINDV